MTCCISSLSHKSHVCTFIIILTVTMFSLLRFLDISHSALSVSRDCMSVVAMRVGARIGSLGHSSICLSPLELLWEKFATFCKENTIFQVKIWKRHFQYIFVMILLQGCELYVLYWFQFWLEADVLCGRLGRHIAYPAAGSRYEEVIIIMPLLHSMFLPELPFTAKQSMASSTGEMKHVTNRLDEDAITLF